jgi:hypothetical protein
MATPTSTIFAAALTFAAAIYGALHVFLHITQSTKEPPPAPGLVPFIGPMIGLSRKKSKYYTEQRLVIAKELFL